MSNTHITKKQGSFLILFTLLFLMLAFLFFSIFNVNTVFAEPLIILDETHDTADSQPKPTSQESNSNTENESQSSLESSGDDQSLEEKQNLDEEVSSQVVRQRARLQAEIEDQHAQLLSQLNQYQSDERQFRISLDQFQRLQTLQSIEKVVEDSKKLIITRNTVLDYYLNLLRLKLIESEGVEISHQDQAIEQIEILRKQLAVFTSEVKPYSQREEINNYTQQFLPFSERIHSVSYYSLVILAIGKLQAVYDQSVIVNQNIQEKYKGESTLVNSKDRSLNEINKLLKELPPDFSALWLKVAQSSEKDQGYESLYRSINRDLTPIYAKLSRLVSYYQELEGVK